MWMALPGGEGGVKMKVAILGGWELSSARNEEWNVRADERSREVPAFHQAYP